MFHSNTSFWGAVSAPWLFLPRGRKVAILPRVSYNFHVAFLCAKKKLRHQTLGDPQFCKVSHTLGACRNVSQGITKASKPASNTDEYWKFVTGLRHQKIAPKTVLISGNSVLFSFLVLFFATPWNPWNMHKIVCVFLARYHIGIKHFYSVGITHS